MDPVFTIFLAGCAHGAVDCVELDRFVVTAESTSACEQVLDRRLKEETADFPEFLGLCVAGDGPAVAQIPDWAPLS